MIGKTVSVSSSLNYLFYEKHRGKVSDLISVWNINTYQELDCFTNSINQKWQYENNCWGFILDQNQYLILGHNLLNDKLLFAKFIGDQNNLWHGYPADFKNKPNDKPKNAVLMQWINDKLITKSVFRKIQQGQI